MVEFSERLKSIRKSKKLTQKQVANEAGIAERAYQSYEGNERKPTFENLIALADYFNVTIDYLAGRADESKM